MVWRSTLYPERALPTIWLTVNCIIYCWFTSKRTECSYESCGVSPEERSSMMKTEKRSLVLFKTCGSVSPSQRQNQSLSLSRIDTSLASSITPGEALIDQLALQTVFICQAGGWFHIRVHHSCGAIDCLVRLYCGVLVLLSCVVVIEK